MTTKTTVSGDEVRDAIRRASMNAYRTGRNWHYVRVWPDGSVVVGEEVSKCLPESEYFGRAPHPVTVWSMQSNYASTPDDGIFDWLECDHDADAEFFVSPDGRKWCRPEDRADHPECTRPMEFNGWNDDCDFTAEYRTAFDLLTACDWFEVEDGE